MNPSRNRSYSLRQLPAQQAHTSNTERQNTYSPWSQLCVPSNGPKILPFLSASSLLNDSCPHYHLNMQQLLSSHSAWLLAASTCSTTCLTWRMTGNTP